MTAIEACNLLADLRERGELPPLLASFADLTLPIPLTVKINGETHYRKRFDAWPALVTAQAEQTGRLESCETIEDIAELIFEGWQKGFSAKSLNPRTLRLTEEVLAARANEDHLRN